LAGNWHREGKVELTSLLIGLGSSAYNLIAFVIALSVIVFIHEYGHYIVGRWCGIKAQVFSLGFGPVLTSWVDKHGTRWQIAAFPFGGFVKFLGDANAASGADGDALSEMKEVERAQTMHGAPLHKRALTVVAGPMANFILTFVILLSFALVKGFPTEKPIIGSINAVPYDVSEFERGDLIVEIDGTEVTGFEAIFTYSRATTATERVAYVVERDGERHEVEGPFPFPALVAAVTPQSAAAAAGLKVGDVVTAANGSPVFAFSQLQAVAKSSLGKPIALDIWRDGETHSVSIQPRVVDYPSQDGGFEQRILIGVGGGLFFEPLRESSGVFEGVSIALQQIWMIISGSLSGLYHVVSGAISTCNLQGPIGIAGTAGDAASQGAENFIWIIAVLSTAIGLLNLFPIPVLDGGHLMFYAYEAVTGREASDRVTRVVMAIGLTLLLTVMVLALGNDIFCP
jgi:regulator of sigma E protease